MPRVLKNCESHSLTLPFLGRATRVMWALENQITEHRLYLQCSFVNMWPSSWLGHEWTFAMAMTSRNPSCAFSLEKYKESENGWPHHMWMHNRLWTQDSFYVRKHKESEPKECDRITCKFTITLNPSKFYLRKHKESKTQGIWGGWYHTHFRWKTQGIGGVGHPWHINLKSKWSPGAIYAV